jgi:MerR family transcriptional regulator, mercuric resistance operon regulatory protein
MRTGQVAANAGVNVQTLRYYERRGLLPAPERRDSGYREYTSEAVRVVRFVKRAQQLGFTLDDVEALLELAAGGPESCDAVEALAMERIAELDDKIGALLAMRDSLGALVRSCAWPRADRECPLLEAIDNASREGHEHAAGH